MRTHLLNGTAELAEVFRSWCGKAQDIRIVTAWATTDCAVCDCLTKARNKISTMVVGLDFYTTSPSLLYSFRSVIRIGKALQGGTFHPKLYLFENDDDCCCVMGSSNFTSGGFGNNAELNVCVEGPKSDLFFKQVCEYIDEQEQESEEISSAEIADYRGQFEKLKAARKNLERFRIGATAAARARTKKKQEEEGTAPPEQLNKTWREFVRLILAPKRRKRIDGGKAAGPDYLQTAERCQHLFAQHKNLAGMSGPERQFVGGTISEGGWFGSMKGAGNFKERLNRDPASLDAALDHIPVKGKVAKAQYETFAAEYQWDRAGVGTASRLLAMKRPDLFMCIDSKNRSQIAGAFSVSATSLQTFDGYWNLMQRIWRCPWYRATRPQDQLERRIWNARVALLDSIYYEHNDAE